MVPKATGRDRLQLPHRQVSGPPPRCAMCQDSPLHDGFVHSGLKTQGSSLQAGPSDERIRAGVHFRWRYLPVCQGSAQPVRPDICQDCLHCSSMAQPNDALSSAGTRVQARVISDHSSHRAPLAPIPCVVHICGPGAYHKRAGNARRDVPSTDVVNMFCKLLLQLTA